MEIAQLTELRYIVSLVFWSAAAAYFVAVRFRVKGVQQVATIILYAGLVLHFAEYVGRGALHGAAGGAPFTDVSGFLSLAALLFALAYLFTQRRLSTVAPGVFALPVVATLHTASVLLFREPLAVPHHLQGPHLVVHIVLVTFACVGLAAALVSGITYLSLDSMLRSKRTGVLFRQLPNLDLLSKVHRTTLVIGANTLGLGAVVGALWAKDVWGFYFAWDQPKLVITLVAFLAGNACLLVWRLPLWKGRRAVWMAVSTIGLTFAAMAFAGSLSNELHRFVG